MSNEFNMGSYFKSQTGELYFGGINGFNFFDPKSLISKKNDIEVLILTDTVDNFWVNVIANYQEKHLKPVSSAELTIENNKNEPEIIDDAKNALLLNIFKETLGVAIGEVKISKKLVPLK